MKEQWYEITDLSEFVNSTRKMVFHFFGKLNIKGEDIDSKLKEIWQMGDEELEELDSTLSFDECMIIAKNHLKAETSITENNYRVSDRIFMNIVEDINSRLVSNILANLASKGLIETAFDEETNDFCFWVCDKKDENSNNTDQ